MKEEAKVNYAFALKNYQQNGRGRSMKKLCEEEDMTTRNSCGIRDAAKRSIVCSKRLMLVKRQTSLFL